MEADRAIIFGPMRLPFLVLPPACVALGAATAAWSGSEINLFYLLIALIGAVSAHISVNALNEHGIPAYPPMSKGMPLPDLELPALHGETLDNIWTWGKTITNSPNVGDGYFSPYLIRSGSYPIVPV